MSGKIHNFALSFVLSSLLSTAALAQAATPASDAPAPNPTAGPRIAIVNIQDAIMATNEGKRDFDAIQKRFEPKQAELKTLSDEVENMKKQLQANGDKLNEEARSTQVRTLETKQKSFQRSLEDAQNEFQQANQEIVNRIGQKMMGVLEKYAKTNGYAVVLDASNPQTSVLCCQSADITKELVEAYNTESPVTAPATTPATKPAATRPAGTGTTAPRPAATPTTPKKPQ